MVGHCISVRKNDYAEGHASEVGCTPPLYAPKANGNHYGYFMQKRKLPSKIL